MTNDPPGESSAEGPSIEEVLAASTDLVVAADESLMIRFASRGAKEVLGYEPAEVVGRNGLEFLHPDDAPLFAAVAARSSGGYTPRGSIFYRLLHRDGSYVTLELMGGPTVDESSGRVTGFWLVGRRPVRAEIYAEVLHRLLDEQPLTVALGRIGESMLPGGAKFCITLWLPREPPVAIGDRLPAELTGRSARPGSPWDVAMRTVAPVTCESLSDLDETTAAVAREEGLSSVTVIPVTGLDGRPVATLTHWTPPGVPHAAASAQVMDRIKDLVAAAIRLHQQIEGLRRTSNSDPLTGLANRRALQERLAGDGRDAQWSVISLDLDGFKEVNDTYGHATGDHLLQIVARRIQSETREKDLAVRMGGDEFALVCRDCGPDEARRLSERILVSLREPIVIDGARFAVRGSIGVASGQGIDDELLRRADEALYRAKREGRDTVRVA